MAGTVPIPFSTQFDPRHGEPVAVAPGVVRIVAPNASPYTFTGTNSYLVGGSRPILIDPGPDDPEHLAALERALAGRTLTAIVLTHTHRDHCALARAAAARFDAPIWSAGPHRLSRPLRLFERNTVRSGDFTLVPDRLLAAGDRIETDAGSWSVLPTPGHCANHIALLAADGSSALVGDNVMGWSSTLVAAPDGDLDAYLASLETISVLPHRLYLPGHGGEIEDGPAMARALLAHREARNEQIVAAIMGGASRLETLMEKIYPHIGALQARLARRTLMTHLEALERKRRIRLRRSPFGLRIVPRAGAQSPI